MAFHEIPSQRMIVCKKTLSNGHERLIGREHLHGRGHAIEATPQARTYVLSSAMRCNIISIRSGVTGGTATHASHTSSTGTPLTAAIA